jgi:hypothetical protein
MTQDVGPEFKPQYCKKEKEGGREKEGGKERKRKEGIK